MLNLYILVTRLMSDLVESERVRITDLCRLQQGPLPAKLQMGDALSLVAFLIILNVRLRVYH